MKFLADHDIYTATNHVLTGSGHDVVRAADIGLASAPDEELLSWALQGQRILITRDRDFGSLVFVGGTNAGVIYLRIEPSTVSAVHAELDRLLRLYAEQKLLSSFVVVEPGRHRIRRLRS